MKLGKEFVDAYADFSTNAVTVEIPFISTEHGDDFIAMITKSAIQANLKGNFTILTTPAVIVGFTYDFAGNETREYIEIILEILSGLIMMRYYDQRDKAEIIEVQLAIAA